MWAKVDNMTLNFELCNAGTAKRIDIEHTGIRQLLKRSPLCRAFLNVFLLVSHGHVTSSLEGLLQDPVTGWARQTGPFLQHRGLAGVSQ